VGDLLEISEMGVEEGGANSEEVGVARVVDFDDTPWVLAVGTVSAYVLCLH